MKVELLEASDLKWLFYGYRICTDSLNKIDSELNQRIVEASLKAKPPHISPLKHLNYRFLIIDISRSLLQELVRHQIGVSINVKSTRFTLHRIAKDIEVNKDISDDFNKVENLIEKYYFIDKDLYFNNTIPKSEYESWIYHRYSELMTIKALKKHGTKNDNLKMYINENFRTTVFMTISALALRNLFYQRLSPGAWSIFKHLAKLLLDSLPKKHYFLYKDVITV